MFGGDSVNAPLSQFSAVPFESTAEYQDSIRTAAPRAGISAAAGRWGRWFVDFADHSQVAVSARSREEAIQQARNQSNTEADIIGVTQEDTAPRAQAPAGRQWQVQFADGQRMTVTAQNHYSAEQEVLRTTNYSANEINSIVLAS